jgi:hypothetical protein
VCEYNKNIALVHYRKNSLLEYDGVYLAEGPWPEKAYFDAEFQARRRAASYYLDYGWTAPAPVSVGPAPRGIIGSEPPGFQYSHPDAAPVAPAELVPPPAPVPDAVPNQPLAPPGADPDLLPPVPPAGAAAHSSRRQTVVRTSWIAPVRGGAADSAVAMPAASAAAYPPSPALSPAMSYRGLGTPSFVLPPDPAPQASSRRDVAPASFNQPVELSPMERLMRLPPTRSH